eukprot:13252360-Ditylum_brightwellii.AAC.1
MISVVPERGESMLVLVKTGLKLSDGLVGRSVGTVVSVQCTDLMPLFQLATRRGGVIIGVVVLECLVCGEDLLVALSARKQVHGRELVVQDIGDICLIMVRQDMCVQNALGVLGLLWCYLCHHCEEVFDAFGNVANGIEFADVAVLFRICIDYL